MTIVGAAGEVGAGLVCPLCNNYWGYVYTSPDNARTYQEVYSVPTIPGLTNSEKESRGGYDYYDIQTYLIVAEYNGQMICQSCLEEKIAEYKSAHETAIDSSGSASVPITVTREAMVFSVTLPTTLPLNVASDGIITTANNAVITNNCAAYIDISQIQVQAINDWTLIPYSKGSGKNLTPASKNIGLQLTIGSKSVATKSTGASEVVGSYCATNIAPKSSCSIAYTAEIPAQPSALTNVQVANVIFTVDWSDEQGE